MRRSIVTLLGLVAALGVGPASADETGLKALSPHYETTRLALADDSMDGVPHAAMEIREGLEALQRDLSAERAGVAPDKLPEVEALLPEAAAAARQLEEAKDLAAARDAFYALSKPLVRWRQAAGEGPSVVYCAMEKRSWLQVDDNEISNPYLGKEMPTCGEIVSP